ncbi:hypothetical protein [Bradyrhizobium sp. WSM3983]|uniref:hypothetical protein n=1 Tax=Bradyrhizobium sp. WSM3983 TaxID=1038867 RepID=UPI000412BB3F|nr:hypothetical protein [Bradyrhizobium sp. WSM3983]
MTASDTLENPFVAAQQKFDKVSQDLVLTTDELTQTKEAHDRLYTALTEAGDELTRVKAEHDKTINQMLADHSTALAARDEQIATLTRERDTFKTLSIQQTVRLRDFGETALRIVNDSRMATMNDPALDAYAKPLAAPTLPAADLSEADQTLLKTIVGTETAAAA